MEFCPWIKKFNFVYNIYRAIKLIEVQVSYLTTSSESGMWGFILLKLLFIGAKSQNITMKDL